LKYSSPRAAVALENGQLPTTRQEPELMFCNNGLLHHNVITAVSLMSSAQCWQITLVLRLLSWLSSCALAQHWFTRPKNFSCRARPAASSTRTPTQSSAGSRTRPANAGTATRTS